MCYCFEDKVQYEKWLGSSKRQQKNHKQFGSTTKISQISCVNNSGEIIFNHFIKRDFIIEDVFVKAKTG